MFGHYNYNTHSPSIIVNQPSAPQTQYSSQYDLANIIDRLC